MKYLKSHPVAAMLVLAAIAYVAFSIWDKFRKTSAVISTVASAPKEIATGIAHGFGSGVLAGGTYALNTIKSWFGRK